MARKESIKAVKARAGKDIRDLLFSFARLYRGRNVQLVKFFHTLAERVTPATAYLFDAGMYEEMVPEKGSLRPRFSDVLRHECIRLVTDYWTLEREDDPGVLDVRLAMMVGILRDVAPLADPIQVYSTTGDAVQGYRFDTTLSTKLYARLRAIKEKPVPKKTPPIPDRPLKGTDGGV